MDGVTFKCWQSRRKMSEMHKPSLSLMASGLLRSVLSIARVSQYSSNSVMTLK